MSLDEPKIPREKLLTIVTALSTALAVFLILYASLALLMPGFIADLLGDTSPEALTNVLIFGAMYFIIALILLVGSIGVFFKVRICRYLVIAASSYMIIFGFPIAIALFLCEKDIKALFSRE